MQRLRPDIGAGASPQLVLTVASSNSGWVHAGSGQHSPARVRPTHIARLALNWV